MVGIPVDGENSYLRNEYVVADSLSLTYQVAWYCVVYAVKAAVTDARADAAGISTLQIWEIVTSNGSSGIVPGLTVISLHYVSITVSPIKSP